MLSYICWQPNSKFLCELREHIRLSKKRFTPEDTAKDIMQPVVMVSPGTVVRTVLELIDSKGVDYAVIAKSNGQVTGIYSLSDTMAEINSPDHGEALLTTPIDNYMTQNLVVVAPTDKCYDIVKVLHEAHIHRAVVVERLSPIGIVSQRDLNHWFIEVHKNNKPPT